MNASEWKAFDNSQTKSAAALLGAAGAMHAPSLLAILAKNCPMVIGSTPEWLIALIAATDFRCLCIAGYWLLVYRIHRLEDHVYTRIR